MNSNGSASKISSDLDPAQAPALDEEPMTEDQIDHVCDGVRTILGR